ncbi:hypothetical protein, variant 5 [Aphanomyces invadans]|uniref:GOLD domain-containing protein n=1 Tax=Aphanomyces invadans TaxID=157072 RepID=A0A024TC02_9STRA|nr:hypothetical protein, variant 4 [Aphanomyces invadans]XP_008879792.1 hypothetical protein, variant 5 [Aphanomyces invadans]ETV91523.1 hypothetical protein, variant 4 [Aphanomyces invadans]ETV91524.1 hypothetical protein, variant 5 [Aphanomyces invadans]|eukprot:XP_008879791.1 hypothetical protein, variant 4 [Aphanomyces invadans]
MVAALLLPWVGVLALVSCFSSVGAGSSFAFDLDGNQEECFREDIVPRSLHSDLFVHFELLEPRRPTDALNVKVVSPSGVTITTWTHATANHTSLNVRESGLYSLCFTSAPGSKAQQRVLYVVDVVTYGTRSLTRDPTVIATLIQQFPDKPNPSTLMLATERGVPVSMGVVEYSFAGISVHALHENTRVIASFSVDFASKPGIEVTLAAIPGNRVVHPPTWTSMTTHIDSFYDRVITNHGVLASTGGSLFFDITDTVRGGLSNSTFRHNVGSTSCNCGTRNSVQGSGGGQRISFHRGIHDSSCGRWRSTSCRRRSRRVGCISASVVRHATPSPNSFP